MSLLPTFEGAAGPHAWTKDAPSEKALGKRKMTERQLKAYYAKQPKLNTDYDSDDAAQRPMSTIYSHNPHNNFNLQLALETRRNQENMAPVNVAVEDEHARDLLEALHGRYLPIEQSESVVDINADDISDLITEAEQESESQRLVKVEETKIEVTPLFALSIPTDAELYS